MIEAYFQGIATAIAMVIILPIGLYIIWWKFSTPKKCWEACRMTFMWLFAVFLAASAVLSGLLLLVVRWIGRDRKQIVSVRPVETVYKTEEIRERPEYESYLKS